jgi:tetratricopeptide (TPR) repeat protein
MPTLVEDLRQVIERDQWAARPLLHDLVERLPKSVEARALLAQSYLRSLEAMPALEHYRIAHELDPKNIFLRHQMGLCATALGDYEAALTIFRDANAVAPNEHSQCMAGLLLHRLGRAGEAIKTYSDLLSRMKRDHLELPHALRGLAMTLRDAGLPLASDRILTELVSLYRLDPLRVAGLVAERDNSIDHPGWTQLAGKAELALALRRSQDQPWAPRAPRAFLMPEDREALVAYAAAQPGALFIAKPRRGTGGQNMAISRDAKALSERPDVVVQRYIERPYLVDGRKGHVRLHGVVASLDPFRAYLHAEGVVRFAPEAYDSSDAGLADVHAHITNTALHKDHPKLVVSQKAEEENVGAIWSLTAYLERLKADGVDVAALREALKNLARGFVRMVHAEGVFDAQAKFPRRSFPAKLFGLDVLIDADATPWLIEAQRKPAMSGSPLVSKIAGKAMTTIFEMTCGFLFDDAMPAERIAGIAKDRAAAIRREAEHEAAFRGQFEPL